MPEAATSVSLAIEASGSEASVAVGRGSSLLHLEPVTSAARHGDDLMPAIERTFRRIQASPKDLEAIFVSIGPGGFTGLRIAVATAKMLAFATGCRLHAVSEAEAVLEASAETGPMLICLAGKRGCYWTAAAGSGGAAAGQVLDLQQITDLAARSGVKIIAVNQAPDRVSDLGQVCAKGALDLVSTRPDASHVWSAGRRRLPIAPPTPPADLLPLYPREPEAIRLWRERHG